MASLDSGDYPIFVERMGQRRNRLAQGKLEQESACLRPLPPAPMPEYVNYWARVRSGAPFSCSATVVLNSSVGILSISGERSNKKPNYPRFSIDGLRKLSVSNFAAIGGAAERLAAAYDALAERTLLPLPRAGRSGVRLQGLLIVEKGAWSGE